MSLKKEENQSTFSLDQLLQITRKTPKNPIQAPSAPTKDDSIVSSSTPQKKPRKKTTKNKVDQLDDVNSNTPSDTVALSTSECAPKKRGPKKKSSTSVKAKALPTSEHTNTTDAQTQNTKAPKKPRLSASHNESSSLHNEVNYEKRSSIRSEVVRSSFTSQSTTGNTGTTRLSIRNSENSVNENDVANVKSYGVGVNKEKETNDAIVDEHLILHIPVVLGSRSQKTALSNQQVQTTPQKGSSANDSHILAYATDMSQDNLKTTPKKRECEKCFITEDGSLLYCDQCTQIFNEKQQAKRNFEKMQQDRKNDDQMYKQIYSECELDLPHIEETKMSEDTPLPVYDPEDIQTNSNIVTPLLHIKPTSLINQELDDQAPSRDQFEKLKCEYELLQQRYLKLLKDNRTTQNAGDEITSNIWKDRMKIIDLMKRAKVKVTKSFELPMTFGNANDPWPTRVPICCMFDAHPFDSVPIPLPLSYNSVTDTFRVFGCFCSVQCALGFKKSNRSLEHIDTSLFFFFLNKLQDEVGKFIPDGITVHPAPNPYALLDIYGGPMTIEEFRSMSQSYALQAEIITFPLEPVPQFLQVTNQLVNAELDASLLDFNNVDNKKVKKLKIQRNKPLPNHKNRLEASMGLMIDDQVVN